jgi:hypothetical protein
VISPKKIGEAVENKSKLPAANRTSAEASCGPREYFVCADGRPRHPGLPLSAPSAHPFSQS